MGTAAIELTRALIRQADVDSGANFTLFCSRERPEPFSASSITAVISPYRHELANKFRWLPAAESGAELDAMLYPYWPAPPLRRKNAPEAWVMIHDLAFRLRPQEVPWQQRLYLGRLVPRSLRQAKAILTPSEATQRDLLAAYPLAGLESRLYVIPLGSGLEGVATGSLPRGLAPGFILAVGTIEPRKNYLRLLQAHRLLRLRRPIPQLVVAGRPGWAYGATLDELARDPEVRLLGHVEDSTLKALYQKAELLAFPSLYEGFGLPLLEAMKVGLPALVGAAGALPELGGPAALAVDPLDPQAIADGLERLLDDADLRRRLAEAGLARAQAYTWEASADRLLGLLRTQSS
jgi:glycosyltransferase involved in cell wall biosynthesis